MLYDAYEMQRSLLAGASTLANLGADWLNNPANPLSYSQMGPIMASALDVFAHASAPRGKPAFGLTHAVVQGEEVRVVEEVVLRKPFGQLKRFRRVRADGSEVTGQPRLLMVEGLAQHDFLVNADLLAADRNVIDAEFRLAARRRGVGEYVQRRGEDRPHPAIGEGIGRILHPAGANIGPRARTREEGALHFISIVQHAVSHIVLHRNNVNASQDATPKTPHIEPLFTPC
jgi:hypothetical protein